MIGEGQGLMIHSAVDEINLVSSMPDKPDIKSFPIT
jgi:hypothetical protein